MNKYGLAILALVTGLLAAPATAGDGGHDHGGGRSHEITTASAEAQRLFDRGLGLAWGFNHLEAARAFRAATVEDPDCAMCWWGVALVLGPNINAPLDAQYFPEIRQALDRAKQLASAATRSERAYIEALDQRYGDRPLEDRSHLDRAYAKAMRRVAFTFPDDLDAATLFAEAVMDTMPWDYWTGDRQPKAETVEFLDVLESVLKREPAHAGANHLLIHAVEKTRPDLGVPAAERLERAPQATGHLIHMASHIYIRVGRYDDAARVNEMAIADDDAYAARHEVPQEYVAYMLHNHHMRWAALTLEGRSEDSRAEAEYLAANAHPEAMMHPVFGPFIQHLLATPLFDHLRYERWQEVLAQPEPAEHLHYPRALRHFGRGIALVRTDRVDAAQSELSRLRELASADALADAAVNFNPVPGLLAIAESTLAGEIAGARGDWSTAIRALEDAITREDALVYDEPPPWLPPARQWLGDLLLRAGRSTEALAAYREDLEIYPRNARSLEGVERSLAAGAAGSAVADVQGEE